MVVNALSTASSYHVLIRVCRNISKKGISRLIISQMSIAFTYDVFGSLSEMLMKKVVSTSNVVTLTVTVGVKSVGYSIKTNDFILK